jgi:Uncharacterized proteins, homologs of microcin C7 resistance protein MccF
MRKRTFIKTLGLGLVSLSTANRGWGSRSNRLPLILPSTIKPGDTVGIITPSSPLVDERGYAIAEENFRTLGLRIKWGRHVGERDGHLAGTDEARLADLHGMFNDEEVKAIICLRGGSGAARLLDKLDYGLISRHPKIFLGYSDITAYHQAIYTQTGLVTFHGAVANSKWTPMVFSQFENLFFKGMSPTYAAEPGKFRILNGGIAEGRLLGGNLTVLTGIAGSKYYPDFEDGILFIEDVGEEPYRVDRMFSQLALSGALSKIKGFIFGQCTDCEAKNPENSLTLERILDDYIRPLGIPAFRGASIGHIDEQYIMPVGAKAQIDSAKGSITVLETIFSTK